MNENSCSNLGFMYCLNMDFDWTILKMNPELFAYDVTQERVVACTNHFAIAFVC